MPSIRGITWSSVDIAAHVACGNWPLVPNADELEMIEQHKQTANTKKGLIDNEWGMLAGEWL